MAELARDFVRAGLYDRRRSSVARWRFGRDPPAALALLVRIHELQPRLDPGGRRARAAAGCGGVPEQPVASPHHYCELAEAAIAERDFAKARDLLRRARLSSATSAQRDPAW